MQPNKQTLTFIIGASRIKAITTYRRACELVIIRMDVRNHLVEDKHYALVPVPVIEMLARAGLSGTQMSIYMLHWSAGHIAGDWKSTIACSVLVERLNVSRATVQRAYRGLVKKGMIRRALGKLGSYEIPEVEVLIPDSLQETLSAAPSRRKAHRPTIQVVETPDMAVPSNEAKVEVELDDPEPFTRRYQEEQQRLQASKPQSKSEARLEMLRASCQATKEKFRAMWLADSPSFRNIHPKYAYKVRKAIADVEPSGSVTEVWHQVMWTMERGIFSGRNVPHAFNTAMWMLRRGAWKTPSEMPEGWRWSYTPSRNAACQM